MELWRCSVAELQVGYRSRQFSPTEVLDSLRARIAAVNPILNAVVTLNDEDVTQAASLSSDRWLKGKPVGPLDGMFVTVKDNIPVRGLRCTWGSRAFAHYVPERDELAVARLREAGTGILGKSNVPEFALQGHTDNLVFGATGNPWAPNLTPGGSSGGAVAAVAAGIGVAALATDGGGSIRRPCAYTGLYGLKPSPGLIPRADHLPALLHDFEAVGIIARSPDDLLAILAGIAGPDPRDRLSVAFVGHSQIQTFSHRKGSKILYIPAFEGHPVDAEIIESVDKAARLLNELGHHVETGPIPFDINRLNSIWALIGAVGLASFVDGERLDVDIISPSLVPLIENGRKITASAYVQLLSEVHVLRIELARVFERYAFILTPSIAGLPWPKSDTYPAVIDGVEVEPRGHAVFTPFANVGGLPGINLPTDQTSTGLPIGCQLVGPYGSDMELLSIAKTYESAFGRFTWPELSLQGSI